MRIIGLDFGTKTVGVALSDELQITAQALETITRKSENKLRQTLARIEEIIKEYQVEKIVLGYPKNMNNTVGERAAAVEEFKEALERRTGLEVIFPKMVFRLEPALFFKASPITSIPYKKRARPHKSESTSKMLIVIILSYVIL